MMRILQKRAKLPALAVCMNPPHLKQEKPRNFGESRPALSVVPVPALHHGCLIEIEAVAACDL
jgi:enamine deaminase RidA (YjgF/YER057c/UK114 family)